MKTPLITILICLISLSAFAQETQKLQQQDQYQDVLVAEVIDGNTIELESGEKVRLIGIDKSDEAYEFIKRRVEGKAVELEFDEQQRDEEGTLLAYVYFSSRFNIEIGYYDADYPKRLFLNAEMIKKGYAKPAPDSVNIKYADFFQQLYQATKRKKGIFE